MPQWLCTGCDRPRGSAGPAIALATALLAAGCGDDGTVTADVGPVGNPTITFVTPPSDATSTTCLEVPAGDDARVPLLVDWTELVIRPPGGCGSYVQCGHLALYVDDVLNNETAVPAIDLLLRKVADRYHDGSLLPGSGAPDLLGLRVEVQDDTGAVLADHQGEPLASEVGVITASQCPPSAP